MTTSELTDMIENYMGIIENAFDSAADEPKISSVDTLISSNSRPLAPAKKADAAHVEIRNPFSRDSAALAASAERPEAMRKQMTRAFDEILTDNKDVVYIGEDVEHGG